MRITQWSFRGATVLELHGSLMGPEAIEALDAAVRRSTRAGPPRLVLDLGDMPSIDAAGLGALVSGYGAVRRRGGTFKLAHPAKRVHALLVMCRLDTVLETFDSLEAAVGDGRGPSSNSSPISSPPLQLSQTSLDVIEHFLRRA